MKQTALLWLRNDLRSDDHPLLATAAKRFGALLPVYCVDPRQFQPASSGFARVGPHRAQFLLETLAELRGALQALGSDLHVAVGEPAVELAALAASCGADLICAEAEVASEELNQQRALRAATKLPLELYASRTLLRADDLPFALPDLPDVFTAFRKAVESRWRVAEPLPSPRQLPPLPTGFAAVPPPSLADLGVAEPPPDARAALAFRGGEGAALARLKHYVWQQRGVQTYKETRNGLIGADYSSKFSPWLACGALSPRRVYAEVQRFERELVANESTYWLVFELLWRDYFRFVAEKYGGRIFHLGGLRGKRLSPSDDERAFRRWRDGETGNEFIDANMRELSATGFMSNRGRQNVASFLAHDLNLDWRLGAAWFESRLIDYDVYSNQGNWLYVAGVGNDPRQGRRFNVSAQAERYDPSGAYRRLWSN